MTTSLPAPVNHRLEQTLGQWRQWRCEHALQRAPAVVSQLGAGHSNFSVLVEAGEQFVVRIDGIRPGAHGLSRQAEYRALEQAHGAGLAPCPRYSNPELGSLVCDYLAPDPQQLLRPADVAHLLRGIHQLPALHLRLDLAERILRYERMLEHAAGRPAPELAACGVQVGALLRDPRLHGLPEVLCHHDLLRSNRLYSGGRLWALDWEYCAMGNRWYELAVVLQGDELDSVAAAELLQAYLGRAATARELELLQRYACVYRYLELLWYLAAQPAALPAQTLADKQARLVTLLEALRP